MIAVYLYANAALYLVFAIWMTLSPWKTAAAVGYEALAQHGRSEFLVIYGGLQLGLAAFYALLASNSSHHRIGILFSLCLYAPIVAYRVITLLKFEVTKGPTLAVAALEIALLVGAIYLIFKKD